MGVIRMLDAPDVVKRKIGRAVTDSDDSDDPVRYDPETKPGVSNLLDIIAAVTDSDPVTWPTRFTSYGALKAACTDAVVGVLEPIQPRYADLLADADELLDGPSRSAQSGHWRPRPRACAGPLRDGADLPPMVELVETRRFRQAQSSDAHEVM